MNPLVRQRIRVGTLPSEESAEQIVRGDMSAIPQAIIHTLARAGLIGIGLALVGVREGLIKYSLAGALSIETFVLIHTAMEVKQENQ